MTLSRLKFPFIKSSRNSELNIENEIKKIFDEEKYNELAGLRTDISRPSFFPVYRG